MNADLDETHDPGRRSWVASANDGATDFPIQNLPFGVFRHRPGSTPAIGVAIGDQILSLASLAGSGPLPELPEALQFAIVQPTLNALMALDATLSRHLRRQVSALLAVNGSPARRATATTCLVAQREAEMLLPASVGDFTDFLTSAHHTERHGRFKGLADPLPKAFFSLPVAYHGRASSIRVSGTDLLRPRGQFRRNDEVVFGPTQALDFELEIGCFVRAGNNLGSPVRIDDAHTKLFGYCLLNDWSAKDIQWWEQVLGPFLGKSFMTSISPWVVTTEALAPFRTAVASRPEGAPRAPAHLRRDPDDTIDIRMEALLRTPAMRTSGLEPTSIASTSPRHLAWSFEQMLAHHTSNGCDLRPGDLMGSGTVSGPEDDTRACMTEMTHAGRNPVLLPNGEERRWLQDGDEVILRASASSPGFVSIGFGECRGQVLPAT